jgi:hypothetical protein
LPNDGCGVPDEPLNAGGSFPSTDSRLVPYYSNPDKLGDARKHAMRQSWENMVGSTRKSHAREQARVQIKLLAAVCLLIGVGIGTVWLYRAATRRAVTVSEEKSDQRLVELSDGTKAVLQRLDSPIEIRFYALLDRASGPDSLQTFATRVDQLLSAYQQAARGKIKVIRYNSRSDLKTAAADGIKPFALDKGDDCYLGLAVVRNGQKESFPQLSPEWEQALESDLSRAIARLINAPSPAEIAAAVSQIDPAVTAEVKRQIPNFASVSMEEGTRILRESALKDFRVAANEREIQVREAEERFNQAQNGKSEAEQQAALKHLQQVRADQIEKLRQITTRSSAQIEALRRLKEASK